ncbi:MAG: hypothetical protein ACR2M4_00575 [Actinomycetota bacterium]
MSDDPSLQQQSDDSVHRADVAEERADESGHRADVSEERADKAEHRADVAEHKADADRRVTGAQLEGLGQRVSALVQEVSGLKSVVAKRNIMMGIVASLVFGFGILFVILLGLTLNNQSVLKAEAERLLQNQQIIVAVTGCTVDMTIDQCQDVTKQLSKGRATAVVERVDCVIRSIDKGDPPPVTKQACSP